MNTDFIVDGLENFANWGGPIADIFEALGDILGALDGEDGGDGSPLGELSSNLSSDDTDTTPGEDGTDTTPGETDPEETGSED